MRVTTVCMLGLLDLSASFDTVHHDLLAERLSRTYGSARPRLIGIAPISVIANRRSSSMGSSQLSTPSAVASTTAPCSGRCCPCSTLLTWVSLLPVSAYHPTSTLMNLSFKRGNLHQQLYSSGVEWSLVLSGYPNGCMRTHFGDRAFSVAGLRCWNSLPPAIRLADLVDSFKVQLKLTCSLRLTLFNCMWGALVAVWPPYCSI